MTSQVLNQAYMRRLEQDYKAGHAWQHGRQLNRAMARPHSGYSGYAGYAGYAGYVGYVAQRRLATNSLMKHAVGVLLVLGALALMANG